MDYDPVSERTCDIRMDAMECKVNLLIGRLETRIDGMDDALDIRTRELERRLEGLNELRSDVVRDRDQFVRRDMYDAKVNNYDEAVSNFAKRITIMETRALTWTAAIGVFFVIVQIFLHFIQWTRP